ncbi:disulfide bond formation protein B [Epibacterium sp. Ofav1-8]|uniref:disulfide bond formation protein B n=1 Tax=Epibacterium sp. Ofav1-8 TaxID=2917735 RepID=UPI001EF5EF5B|nr:disulfide bond formation protein B [Epibacterium sp. Ofav1-8]MCG7622650.1 disulfide bond formation protein B [Epibacterium sp. Ofav1-8]
MTFSRFLTLIAAGGSAALLLGAFGFQYIGELAPCKMCIWQRYPHGAAVGLGVLAVLIPGAVLPYLGALAALTTAAIGAFHAGVEQGWWEGPTTCTSGAIDGLSADELMSQIMSAPLVRCDDIPWELFGLSMAGWNAVISLVLAAIWVAAARHAR